MQNLTVFMFLKGGLCFSILLKSEKLTKTQLILLPHVGLNSASVLLTKNLLAAFVLVRRSRTALTPHGRAETPEELSRVGEVGAVGDVGGDRRAPTEPAVAPAAARPPGGRPP